VSRTRLAFLIFAAALLVFVLTAWNRLRQPSAHRHFVVQAQAWLDGRLDIARWPAGADDPARVEEVQVDDGRVVRGRTIKSRQVFRVMGGEELPSARVKRLRTIHYNSFPPFPAVLMVPQVLLSGERANDVWFTVLFAAAVPALVFLLLGRLRDAGLSTRSDAENLLLAAILAVGTVFYFSAVQGKVWYTAHVVGVLLCTLYAFGSIEARLPLLAGAALGCAFVTRTPMLFMFPLFLAELWRTRARGQLWRRLVLFGAPIVVIGLLAAWHNHARFGEWGEFGHSYLDVRQKDQIERYGLFDLAYLPRNLRVVFGLLPGFISQPPYLSISGHGLALWVTTPIFLYLVWPRVRGRFHLALWLTVAAVAVPTLFYQNTGWLQFGYRFSLDYVVFLVMLLAIGGRRLTSGLAWTLIGLGVAMNLYGAITFDRVHKAYRADYDEVGGP
jgi:hypothetical protein